MHNKLLWTALLALPVLVATVVYGKALFRCQPTPAPSVAAGDSDQSQCFQSDKSECCQPDKVCCQPGNDDTPKQTEKTPAQRIDPDRLIVFRVEGLTCPAVKGIGCGHMLAPVLQRLDKIEGVEASSANYTGTMIRISVKTRTDRDKVVEVVRKVLAEHKPVSLAGDDLKLALANEQWRGTRRVGELSAIEFRTLALYRIKTFSQAEKLNKETTGKLMQMVEDQWERLAQEAQKEKATQPEDWGNRCKNCIPVILEFEKVTLTAEQLERFKKALMTPCRGEDRPEAPPAPTKREKAR